MELHAINSHATMHTYIYKTTTDGVDISLDVYLPDVTKFGLVAKASNDILRQIQGLPVDTSDHSLPVSVKDSSKSSLEPESIDSDFEILLYYHGGGITSGNKDCNDWFPKWLLRDALKAGFAFISADYTLLSPHTYTGHEILSDVKDCITWIATELNKELARLPNSQLVNPNRLAVSGSSGGGYPCYLSGLYGEPKPKALAPIYAMGGDLLSDYYFVPKTKPFFHQVDVMLEPERFHSLFTAPANAPRVVTTGLNPDLDPRVNYCVYLLQVGLPVSGLLGLPAEWSQKLASLSPEERSKEIPEKDRVLFPQFHVDGSFPPTVFLHARGDTGVLIEESRNMLRMMKAAGVTGELLESEGQHSFDNLMYADDSIEKKNLNRVVPFLLEHV